MAYTRYQITAARTIDVFTDKHLYVNVGRLWFSVVDWDDVFFSSSCQNDQSVSVLPGISVIMILFIGGCWTIVII